MKDKDLRGIILQQFYDRRNEGELGLCIRGPKPLILPEGVNVDTFLRIGTQLGEAGLIEWHGVDGNEGKLIAGVGQIKAAGVDVIEGEVDAPMAINLDQSRHEQHIHISGAHGSVQVGGADSQFTANITADLERLIKAIQTASVTPEQKEESKSKLGAFLSSPAVASIVGASVKGLMDSLGGHPPH